MIESPARTRPRRWIGEAVPRKEDPALLTGAGRFIDDLDPFPNTHHAAILRSPHAHARILSIDSTRALVLEGVKAVLTGARVAEISQPFHAGITEPVHFYPIAVEKVRYVGEPVAVVVAKDRYIAEDALELIDVEYERLEPVVEIDRALADDSLPLHENVGSNVVHERSFTYGEVDAAFAAAEEIVEATFRFPKYASTPIETYGVIAQYQRGTDTYAIHANFQGPFVLHTLLASALRVPGNRLRILVPPDIGGSFGIKALLYPYMGLIALASKESGVPVKWIEDRLEHLCASSSLTDRLTNVQAAVLRDGTILALRLDHVDNVGAYVRAPEPACLYRMHGTSTGAYRIPALAIHNRLVTTNKLPTGLNRGYGGQEHYFALERTMAIVAKRLHLDRLDVVRRNLVRADEFPYHAPAGSVLDSGDYHTALDEALRLAGYQELLATRDRARARGRSAGIGLACVVEPSGSSMGYITIALPLEQRKRSLPKSGAAEAVTIALDPSGAITVRLGTAPQGQGHQTVTAQIVAEELGVALESIEVVAEVDTQTSPWTIASGTYSSRFAPIAAVAVQQAARKVAMKLRTIAAQECNVPVDDIDLAEGLAIPRGDRSKAIPIKRLAGLAHWNPLALPSGMEPGVYETAYYSVPILEAPDDQDRVNSSAVYGFVVDICLLDVDRETGKIEIQRYVSVHDTGRMLNPLLAEGQIRGGFAHGLGGALMEEMVYDENGALLSGTFVDYLCPTAAEIPPLVIGHVDTPSPFTPLGAKGIGEGNSMSVPVTIANAVADALGVDDITLPLTPRRVWELTQR
ncbi:xanthine dehydrogenase family protein molybdopterin-binding subunit [bacterium]|nr:MAG: xanthine dehydrogenase family protein molybdopterin-binding subunit [bacterium]